MSRALMTPAWIASLWLVSAVGLPADAQTPLAVYGNLPTLENLALSPDGTKLAYIRTVGEQRNLYVHLLGQATPLGSAGTGDTKVRYLDWMDNSNLMVGISETVRAPLLLLGDRREMSELVTYDVNHDKLSHMSLQVKGEKTLNVVWTRPEVREVNGDTSMIVSGVWYDGGRALPALFRYDVGSGGVELFARSNQPYGYSIQWLLGDTGEVVGDILYFEELKKWDLKLRRDGRMQVVASGTASIDKPTIVGFNPTGDAIWVQFVEDGEIVWKSLSPSAGTWGPPLDPEHVFVETIKDRKTGRIVGGITQNERYVFFDNELQAHWSAVQRAFPNEQLRLLSHSEDFERILVQVFGPKDGYVYALFDWYTHQTAILGKAYEGLQSVAAVKPISYPAADGLTIPAFLTLPKDREASNQPLIVLPHGGPEAADSNRSDWWAQALANEGYAVLQPNYRGSALSPKFVALGYGEWGRKMQSDLADGVRHLARQGTINPNRVCIVGASYGGYAALAGMTLDPGVYRCAVSVSGISDLKRMLGHRYSWEDSTRADRYWERFLGVSTSGSSALDAISPIEHVKAVTGPVLLIHGRDDTVVPYEQSEAIASALKHAGKSVELVALKNEDHWLSRGATRLQMLQATIEFLRANNPP
jgi:dipeptidyl aminopeptidase/acylaminoacyl peptidase